MPETDRVERAFDHLSTDLAHRSRPPGAGAAVARARRRRTTSLVAAAAAVAVLAGGTALLAADRPSETPIAGADGRAVPDPGPLDAAAMSAATEGWVIGWSDVDLNETLRVLDDCLGGGAVKEPSATPSLNGQAFASTPGVDASAHFFGGLPAGGDAEWLDALSGGFDRCAGSEGEEVGYADGSVVRHWRYTAGDQPAEMWVARADGRIGLGLIEGEKDAAPSAAVTAYADALLAATLDDDSYEPAAGDDDSASSSASPEQQTDSLEDLTAITTTLADWPRSTAGETPLLETVPCLGAGWSAGSTSSMGGSDGGGLSYESVEFDTPNSSARAAASLQSTLRACQSVRVSDRPWTTDGTEVSVFTWDRGGESGHGALWMVVTGSTVNLVAAGNGTEPIADPAANLVAAEIADQVG